MAGGVYSLIPAQRLQEVLENLHQFTGISIQLIDHDGTLLLSFGEPTGYCSILKKNVLSKNECLSSTRWYAPVKLSAGLPKLITALESP